MESRVLDDVKFEKKKAIAKFNRLRMIVRLWQSFQLLVGMGMIFWSSMHVPAVLKTIGGYLLKLSACLFNHHVVFLLGNAIIVTLFVLCRHNDDWNNSAACGDLHSECVKYTEAIHQSEPTLAAPTPDKEPDGVCEEEKLIAECTEEHKAVTQCDDVAAAIENATKLINKFQRIQSEKLKRDIAVKPRPAEVRKPETNNRRKTVTSCSIDAAAAEIENLSSEEFRRRVDAFINKHWSSKPTPRNPFTGENYIIYSK